MADMHAVDGIRAAFGGWLLGYPRAALGAVRVRADRRPLLYTRVLGARHLAQAVLAPRSRGAGWRSAAATVDGLHAMSALVFAAHSQRHRRALVANAATAAAFALADLNSASG